MKTREDALNLLNEWVNSESLKRHCLSVASCMESYADKLDDDKDLYWITGLLHDFDYEKFPDINLHPIKGCEELRKQEYPEDMIVAILGHNEATGIKRYDRMAKVLFAVDELSGLVYALAKVRGDNFEGMTPESVKKAMNKKDFAAKINREDIKKGIEELGVDEEEHFQLVIDSLTKIKRELGF